MIIRPKKSVIEAYFANESNFGQSTLKLLLKGVDHYNQIRSSDKSEEELYYEEKNHFIIGSAVDCWITQGREVFEEEYFTSYAAKPSDKIMSIVHGVRDKLQQPPAEIRDDTLRQAIIEECRIQSYYNNRKDEWLYENICTEASGYWRELIEAGSKQVLSSDQYAVIYNIVSSFTNSFKTKQYCSAEDLPENIDLMYQVAIFNEMQEVPIKILIDLLVINHEAKYIIPVDFKTMGDYVINFPISLRKGRYDIQAAFYTDVLKKEIEEETGLFDANGKIMNLTDYEIRPFRFIVESTISPGKPAVFQCSNELLDIGRNGREAIVKDGIVIKSAIRGYKSLLEQMNWHLLNGFLYNPNEDQTIINLEWEGVD